jgi:preprotein translocase subunit YajC
MTPLLCTLTVLAAEAPGAAGGAGAPAAHPQDIFQSLGHLLPIILIFVVFMWMMSRSQRKRDRERQAMLESVKPKDDVVTVGGIHGRVVRVDPENVVLRIDDEKDVKITMARSGISRVLGKEDKQ